MLFADLVGYTSLAENRDPEQVKNIIDGCFELLVADIAAFGGRVDKLLGDGLLALFGAPVAHEDDPERAVRAALRMQETLAAHAPELRMRVGVNTGEVLVGALRAGGDYTAMGDVVNTASRLQTQARPGAVLVGATTHAATAHVIAYDAQGLLPVRGREEPVAAWLALAPIGLPGQRVRAAVPLIGRETELATLLNGIDLAVRRTRPFLAFVEGEGGVGKGRLVAEVLAVSIERFCAQVLEARCLPYGESSAWAPLAAALRPLLFGDELSPTERAAAVRCSVSSALGERATGIGRIVDGLLRLLGEPSALDQAEPAHAAEELQRAFVVYLDALARQRPLVLSVGDLHWADEAMLGLLNRTVAHLSAMPFVLLTTARPGDDLAWPPAHGRQTSLVLRLDPLERAAADQLVRELLGDDVSAAVVNEVLDRSGGNPLFVEQLAGLVSHGGQIGMLPDTLRGLVSARLDTLPADERSMLDNAAVIGTSGTWLALEEFGRALNQPVRRSTLTALAARDLLEVHGDRWRFRSASVQDVAYQTLTKSARAQRHVGVAKATEPIVEHAPERVEQVAFHYATAARLVRELGDVPNVPDDLEDRAVEWLTRAARQAAFRQVPTSEARLAHQALDMLPNTDDPRRVGLLLLRAEGRAGASRVADATVDLAEAVALAEAAGDLAARARGRTLQASLQQHGGRYELAAALLAGAVADWQVVGDKRGLGSTLQTWAMTCILFGRYSESERLLDQAAELFVSVEDRRGSAWVEQNRAWVAFVKGDTDLADRRLEVAREAFSDAGDQTGLSWVLGLLAFVRFQQGRGEEAEALASQVLRDADERGMAWAHGMMQVLLAARHLWMGRAGEALELVRTARATFKSSGDRHAEMLATGQLVRAQAALGRLTDTTKELEAARAIAMSMEMEPLAAGFASAAFAHAGDARRAVTDARIAVSGGEAQGIEQAETLATLALALVQNGDIDEAMSYIERASDAPGGASFYVRAVQSLVLAASGLCERAEEVARGVIEMPASTYLDKVEAGIALALVLAGRGDADGTRAALADQAAAADGTDDKVVAAVSALTRARAYDLLGRPAAAEDELDIAVGLAAALSTPPTGWISLLATISAAVDLQAGLLAVPSSTVSIEPYVTGSGPTLVTNS